MTVRSIAAFVVLAATISWGQNSAGPLANRRQTVTAGPTSETQVASARVKAQIEARQHVEEMGATLTKMHTLLKQMNAKTSAAASKDSVAKANLEMWSMMLEQLDKQYSELVSAQKAREDLEARRMALYKQADEKAAAAAAAARAAQQAEANAASAAQAPAASQPATAPAAPSTSAPAAAPSATSSPN